MSLRLSEFILILGSLLCVHGGGFCFMVSKFPKWKHHSLISRNQSERRFIIIFISVCYSGTARGRERMMTLTYISQTDCRVLVYATQCFRHPHVAMWLVVLDVQSLGIPMTHLRPPVQQCRQMTPRLLCQVALQDGEREERRESSN